MSDDDSFDLGSYRRAVTTTSGDAQTWFDRGLIWCYAFHHDAAVRSFDRATAADPTCAMAHWGVAYAKGPNYNKPWEAFLERERREAIASARRSLALATEAMSGASEVEQALIRALAARYQDDQPPEDLAVLQRWNDDYAAAMRAVHAAFPLDPDVASLFAEALMNRTPWQLWDLRSGQPAAGADTEEVVRVLEGAIGRHGTVAPGAHPGLLHMYVHAMEMSPHPERALLAADGLRDLVPDAGHLRHMPSHIDVLCGDYYNAIVANDKAIMADDRVYERGGGTSFYTLYRCHNFHFKVYAAMFLAQRDTALGAAESMNALITEELLRQQTPPMADWLEGFLSMKLHVMVRFGMWKEIIALPFPPDPALYCVTTAMLHYAKGVAFSARGEIAAAADHVERFELAFERVPASRTVFNNRCVDILGVARAMLEGELLYRKGNHDEAFERLRAAVDLDDGLPYDEPWAWMQPVRHALGALLLEQGRLDEAEQVYRDDLGLSGRLPRSARHPDNVWSLHGLVECLHRAGKHAEHHALQQRLDLARARADIPIEASCFCRFDHVPAPSPGYRQERPHGH